MWLCAAGLMAVPLLRAAVLSVVSVGICLSERRIVLFPSLFPTDRQSFARNFACRSRFRAFNRCFGHRQADKCPKLCLSVPFPGFQLPFWTSTDAESALTLPVGQEPVCWRVLFRQHQTAADLGLAEMPDSVQVLGYASFLLYAQLVHGLSAVSGPGKLVQFRA